MNKVYFIAPLVALLVFGGFYMNFAKGHAAREEAKKVAVRQEKEAKLRREAEERRKAVEDALKLQEKRKAEKAEREERDRLEKEARQAAIDARDKAFRDKDKLARTVERLNKEITTEKDAIEKIENTKKLAREEEAFLRQYVKQAETNVKSLTEVLDKIAAADAARAAEAAAAAAAAKKS